MFTPPPRDLSWGYFVFSCFAAGRTRLHEPLARKTQKTAPEAPDRAVLTFIVSFFLRADFRPSLLFPPKFVKGGGGAGQTWETDYLLTERLGICVPCRNMCSLI